MQGHLCTQDHAIIGTDDLDDELTVDYALRHFELPCDLKLSLREARERREARANAAAENQRRTRFAKAPESVTENCSHGKLEWQCPAESEMQSAPYMKLLDRKDVDALFVAERSGTRSRDDLDVKRGEALCRKLAAAGEYRRLIVLPAGWASKLNTLAFDFPNFAEVVHYLRAMFYLSTVSENDSQHRKVVRFDPILLDGPPGVGKSYFCQQLADALQVPFKRYDCGAIQTSGELTGSDAMWSNSRTGGVFKTLTEGEYGNPLVLLDELDKVGDYQAYSPETALLALLEPSTAGRFCDLSVPDVRIDARHILWIGTSNDQSRLSAPLRSRFRTFHVVGIQPEQAREFVLKVYREVTASMGFRSSRELCDEVLVRASTLSPRRMRLVLTESLAYARVSGRSHVAIEDFERAAGSKRQGMKRRAGFLD